jgi:PAS domain-containing protein
MFPPTAVAEEILQTAARAVRLEDRALLAVIEDLPIAIYATDAEGYVTYYNSNCIAFAGRTPLVGCDRWCVTWKLFTQDGDVLPHEQCPMALAIRQNRAVRGIEAVAERPDGSNVAFLPFPTPIVDDEGVLLGAVNMLVDLSERQQALLNGLYGEDFKSWQQAVVERVLASWSISELRQLVDEIETELDRQRPPLH